MKRLAIDLQETAQWGAKLLYLITILSILAAVFFHSGFYIAVAIFAVLSLINIYLKHVQNKHTILKNFGLLGLARYLLESIGPELRQYFYSSDTEEKPFSRIERAEVYQKAKNIDSTTSFGSQLNFAGGEVKLRHSMFPLHKKDVEAFSVTFGATRSSCPAPYTVKHHLMISAMSFGSLGKNAVLSLSSGAKMAGIPLNTGEGGLSPYHLEGGADIIYQMGTGKFGCRNSDSSLNDEKLREIAKHPQVKMVEIKFSQGAKPGKGGLLPKEKITAEIAKIRGVPMGQDVVSPERHIECDSPENTVKFIERVQNVSKLPVGIKLCLGNPNEFTVLVKTMKKLKIFPDYIAVDGAEGGTGAAPKSFIDHVGMPLFAGLKAVQDILVQQNVREKVLLVSSGKLISPGKQIAAMAQGADVVYTARGFMMALGCIQALQCNKGTCPVGITAHDLVLQRGLVVTEKAQRVANYVKNCEKDFMQLLAAMGARKASELSESMLYETH